LDATFVSSATCVSSSEMSTSCPAPVWSRARSAARIAVAENIPAVMSTMGTPTRDGGPSSGPVMPIIPPSAWMMKS